VISDPNVVFNTSSPDDSLSSDTFSASPEEAGLNSRRISVSLSLEEVGSTLSEEVGPTLSDETGPLILQGTNSTFDTSRPVSLSQSMSSYVDTIQLSSHDNYNWSHFPLS